MRDATKLLLLVSLPLLLSAQVSYNISTFAGGGGAARCGIVCGSLWGDGGPATDAKLTQPVGVALDAQGNLYIADRDGNAIRRIDAASSVITTVAGTEVAGYTGDGGPATSARLNSPNAVAIDVSGNLYIADSGNNVIRKVDATKQTITTIAGTGAAGAGADSVPAVKSSLNYPSSLAVEDTQLFIADTRNNLVRHVDLGTGLIDTPGIFVRSTDCRTSTLCAPQAITLRNGQLWIADTNNCRVGTVDYPGYFNARYGGTKTICGPGGGDGTPASTAQINQPSGLVFDDEGNLYISERGSSRIRFVPFNSPIIATVAGTGLAGFSGDGQLAVNATLSAPAGLAQEGNGGTIFVADSQNGRVRMLGPCASISPPGISVSSFTYTGQVQVKAPAGCSWDVRSNQSWLLSITVGKGNGAADYQVLENRDRTPRTATMRVGGQLFTVNQGAWSEPTVTAGGFLNSGSSSTAMLSPGGRITLRGQNLAAFAQTASLPLPSRLGGMAVTIGVWPARIVSATDTQLDIEIPWFVQPDQAVLGLYVNDRSSTMTVAGAATSPALFTDANGGLTARKLAADGSDAGPVTVQNPVSPGDLVRVYATGAGIVDLPPADGALATGRTNSYYPISIQVGSVAAQLTSATIAVTGDATAVGVTNVVFSIPAEAPSGNAVPVILSTGSRQSAPATLPVAPAPPLSISLQLASPASNSLTPAAWLQLNVSGLHPAAPTSVRFFDGARFTRTVPAFEVTSGSLATTVPPYWNPDLSAYGPGTVSIEVSQTINGMPVTSNHVDGIQIGDLPVVDLPPGQVTSTVIRALGQSSQEMEGVLSSADSVNVGINAFAGSSGHGRVRGVMDSLQQALAPVQAAIGNVMNGAAPSQPLGQLNGETIALDANVLATTDRLLAALILAQPPIDPPSQTAQSLSSPSLFHVPGGARTAHGSANLPDCEIPDPPASREMRDLLTGDSPAISYAADYQACLNELATLQSIVDFSNDLNRVAQYSDRKLKQTLAYFGFGLPFLVSVSPTSASTELVGKIAAWASIPTYANLAGQSLAGIATLYYYFKTGGDAQSTAASDIVEKNLKAQLGDEWKDLVFKMLTYEGFDALEFKEPFDLAEAFTTWAGAAKKAMGEAPEAEDASSEPSVQADGKGGNQFEPFAGTKTVAVTGTVTDPSTGAPESGSQVQACPPLPGQQAPRTQAPTYDDGSYTVVVPVDFSQPDSGVCQIVIYPQNGANGSPQQTGFVDLNKGPKTINFPDSSPPGVVELRGQDSGTGVYAGCGRTDTVGLLKMDINLQNVAWLELLRSGGSFSGLANYQLVSSSCSGGQVTYGQMNVVQSPVSGTVDPGGQGQMTVGAADYTITITDSAVQGMLASDALAARCANTIQCSFQLQLEVIR
jgi:uncharacterized protein (TIGR03437 family)